METAMSRKAQAQKSQFVTFASSLSNQFINLAQIQGERTQTLLPDRKKDKTALQEGFCVIIER